MSQFDPTDPLYVVVGKLIALCRPSTIPATAFDDERVVYRDALRALDGARPASREECAPLWSVVDHFHRELLERAPGVNMAEAVYVAEVYMHWHGRRDQRMAALCERMTKAGVHDAFRHHAPKPVKPPTKRFLYRLLATDTAPGGPDHCNGFVIAAPDADSARRCAANHAADEKGSTWLNPTMSVCDQVGVCTGIHERSGVLIGRDDKDPIDTEVVLGDYA